MIHSCYARLLRRLQPIKERSDQRQRRMLSLILSMDIHTCLMVSLRTANSYTACLCQLHTSAFYRAHSSCVCGQEVMWPISQWTVWQCHWKSRIYNRDTPTESVVQTACATTWCKHQQQRWKGRKGLLNTDKKTSQRSSWTTSDHT